MSLTGFLKLTGVRKEFERRFPLPELAHVQTLERLPRMYQSDAALVGTASDWLLRMRIAATHPDAHCTWLTGEILEAVDTLCPNRSHSAKRLHEDLFQTFKAILADSPLEREHARACVGWATAERVYRGNDRFGEGIGKFSEEDVSDTFEIGKLFRPDLFAFTDTVHLNPAFGLASEAIGGADADMIVKSKSGVWGLIDFKSTRYPGPKIEEYHQMLGYAILNEWCGRFPTLVHGCVLFSRCPSFLRYDLSGLYRMPDYENFMERFLELAQHYSGNRRFPGLLRIPTVREVTTSGKGVGG